VTDDADETAEVFDRVNAINPRVIWPSIKHQLAQMRTQGSGAIVNCSSLGGLVGLPGRAAYHASKHGVIGLTHSADLEYAARGIRVNAICPGTIETAMVTRMIDSGDLDRDEAAANQPIGGSAARRRCRRQLRRGIAPPVDGGYTARSPSRPNQPPARVPRAQWHDRQGCRWCRGTQSGVVAC
jgi:NAD(P)-dependent dehydrogenase (short-subunit alcohol dehydrogenase family)